MADTLKPVEWITVKECAYLLGVSDKSIYHWCKCGKLKHFKIIGSIRIPLSEVKKLEKKITIME